MRKGSQEIEWDNASMDLVSESRSEKLRQKKHKRIKTRGPIKTGSYTSYVLLESYTKINKKRRKQKQKKKTNGKRNITEYVSAQIVFPSGRCNQQIRHYT